MSYPSPGLILSQRDVVAAIRGVDRHVPRWWIRRRGVGGVCSGASLALRQWQRVRRLSSTPLWFSLFRFEINIKLSLFLIFRFGDATTRTSSLPFVSSLSTRPLFHSQMLPAKFSAVEASCLGGGLPLLPFRTLTFSLLAHLKFSEYAWVCVHSYYSWFWLRFWFWVEE